MARLQTLAAWWLLAATPSLLVAAGRHHSREHAAASRDLLRHLRETQGRNQSSDLPESAPRGPRLVACTLVKNELPYVVEWVEFHRLQGFSRIVIYDDSSDDNIALLETLYRCALAQVNICPPWQNLPYLMRYTCALMPALAQKTLRMLQLVFSPLQACGNPIWLPCLFMAQQSVMLARAREVQGGCNTAKKIQPWYCNSNAHAQEQNCSGTTRRYAGLVALLMASFWLRHEYNEYKRGPTKNTMNDSSTCLWLSLLCSKRLK